MENVTVANLEAELGCFESPSSSAPPRHDHGDLHKLFEPPTESTSRLDPPSKTKSVYSFGADGVLAWTTSAGELLQVANCIDDKLIGAEYKRSIDRGQRYHDRGKMLETAVRQPQGSGFGIGLSLDSNVHPYDKCWINNRWPRFSYREHGLDIHLQYYVQSKSVVQEYAIRNTSQETVSLPYMFSSDICFREHKEASSLIYPISTSKSPARLLLFGNSEVLIRHGAGKCKLTMALFLNGQRQSLWAERDAKSREPSIRRRSADSKEDSDAFESTLRRRILTDQLLDEDADTDFRRMYRRRYDEPGYGHVQSSGTADLASHAAVVTVPAGSTQELRAVLSISSFLDDEIGPSKPLLIPDSKIKSSDDREKHGDEDLDPSLQRIRSRQKKVIDRSKQISLQHPGPEEKARLPGIIKDHVAIGAACARLKSLGEARYHLCMACLIAESLYEENSYTLSNVGLVYATLLYNHGWYTTALNITKHLYLTLESKNSKAKEFNVLREKVLIWLATMYLGTGYPSEAESLYQVASFHPIQNHETFLDSVSAHCLERMAWAQILQKKYEEAHKTYSLLLKLPENLHSVIFSNLGFIERRLGRAEQARSCFMKALGPMDESRGLYACLKKLGASPEDDPKVGEALTRHGDRMSQLFQPAGFRNPINDGPFEFAMARQLEALLCTCRIPIINTATELLGLHSFNSNFLLNAKSILTKALGKVLFDLRYQNESKQLVKVILSGYSRLPRSPIRGALIIQQGAN
ncbi:MAG: hypothetical protein LQ338_005407 [Usnochroma carphineum]|nr:MAG: hypothetical protein LQ338_005407 [Usnochroma carphineum]